MMTFFKIKEKKYFIKLFWKKSKLCEKALRALVRFIKKGQQTTASKITAEINNHLNNNAILTKIICRELLKA